MTDEYLAGLHKRLSDAIALHIQERAQTAQGQAGITTTPQKIGRDYAAVVMEILRAEHENAILWGIGCAACAQHLNHQYAADVKAEQSGMLLAAQALSDAIDITRKRHKQRGTWPTAAAAYNQCKQLARALKRRAAEGRTLAEPFLEAKAITTPTATPHMEDATPPTEGTPR